MSEAPTSPYRKQLSSDDDVATARWRAVSERDRAADGTFVFAVTTTAIYCRPSCPARRPRRENVRFFAAGPEALANGFRACKRCRPDEVAAIDLAIARARLLLDEAGGEPVPLAVLAADVNLSPGHLQREFSRRLGLSPKQYELAHRTERLKREIAGTRTVLDAGFEAGFGSASAVYSAAGRDLGMSPGRFRRGGLGVRIRFASRRTALGQLLLAITDRGLCAARLGASAPALRRELVAEFPNAEIVEDRKGLAEFFARFGSLLAGRKASLPLDLAATPFQTLVWRELQKIPRGETTSYGAVARAIGSPRAVRAVARACAANPVAVVVPCHRVVAKDGALTGYRWGIRRKRRLLDRERS
ncbi:MAG: bifunctional DNA-binding transcriptional regulator/O6-methylguanine-DNA methyltransferase Ada [Thermoanaerobaculia bacterium]